MRFVLIHGGFHGAWCWSRTITELENLGHEAIAIDIPGHGERVHEEATMAGRLDAVLAVLQAGDVLVGHSGGGLEITRAADAAPELVSHVVYLAAALPLESQLMQEALVYRDDGSTNADYDVSGMLEHLHINEDGSMALADVEGAWGLFYHDCDEVTARWAFAQLTPEKAGDTATTPISVPRFWHAELPRSFIVCLQDRAQPRWLADVTARRLGVEPLTIDTSHSPFLSRPAELAQLLIHATTTKPVGFLKPNG
ncbi:MAG TPA: alpha/beta hydrolase [Acidimicrobiales bacterium]|nr:alpha/beta hydrolase [Acidimicrobiales bacterium]